MLPDLYDVLDSDEIMTFAFALQVIRRLCPYYYKQAQYVWDHFNEDEFAIADVRIGALQRDGLLPALVPMRPQKGRRRTPA